MCGLTNKGQESPVKGHNCGFLPHIFLNLHPPKWYMFLQFFVKNKAFCFSKRALHAGTVCNKWLRKALTIDKDSTGR